MCQCVSVSVCQCVCVAVQAKCVCVCVAVQAKCVSVSVCVCVPCRMLNGLLEQLEQWRATSADMAQTTLSGKVRLYIKLGTSQNA